MYADVEVSIRINLQYISVDLYTKVCNGEPTCHWIEEAKNDDPDEMLKEAVEQSGYQMTKVTYPWTEETKENVMEIR